MWTQQQQKKHNNMHFKTLSFNKTCSKNIPERNFQKECTNK